MDVKSILWRRIDTPGHDACRVEKRSHGWILEGMAVFRHDGSPAQLAYYVECDPEWRAREGHVRGWLGAHLIEFSVSRSPQGPWALNGAPVSSVKECVDMDFGFTPATNLPQLQRLALAAGQATSAPAAWLDVSAGVLDVLPQRYERRSEWTYWYEAPTVGYAALLEVDPSGFICRYPGLWEAEV